MTTSCKSEADRTVGRTAPTLAINNPESQLICCHSQNKLITHLHTSQLFLVTCTRALWPMVMSMLACARTASQLTQLVLDFSTLSTRYVLVPFKMKVAPTILKALGAMPDQRAVHPPPCFTRCCIVVMLLLYSGVSFGTTNACMRVLMVSNG